MLKYFVPVEVLRPHRAALQTSLIESKVCFATPFQRRGTSDESTTSPVTCTIAVEDGGSSPRDMASVVDKERLSMLLSSLIASQNILVEVRFIAP